MVDFASGGDQRFVRVPNTAATLVINWQATQKLNIDLEASYSGSRFSDRANATELKSYGLVNMAATYEFTENFKLFAKLHNLFDEEYEVVRGYNTYGRSIYGGFEFSF